MKLIVLHQPKPGSGNFNDGNRARRFFKNAEISAEITKVDLALIKKMRTILVVISCGREIHLENFRNFAHNTAKYFVEKYPWFCMTPSIHKFLIHGPEIIKYALLPIGELSEEAQEARNKDFKNYREHFARKCSREESNEDILNRFFLSSDPFISSINKQNERKEKQQLSNSELQLLLSPIISQEIHDSESNDSEDYDDEGEDEHNDTDEEDYDADC